MEKPAVPEQAPLACRFCQTPTFSVLELGELPLANSLLRSRHDEAPTYPTTLHVCPQCSAAQLDYCVDKRVLYEDYVYVTPESEMLSSHYQAIIDFLFANDYLDVNARVLEIGSNIGHFLQAIKPRVRAVSGIDPASNIVRLARLNGIDTINDFFHAKSARRIRDDSGKMDLIVARHCFAHNEHPWKMLEGVQELLHRNGLFVIENAYFADTVAEHAFDQIYHEHMYYYNCRAINEISSRFGFEVIDVLHSDIHGGTMLYMAQKQGGHHPVSARVQQTQQSERDMHTPDYYRAFAQAINKNRERLNRLIASLQAEGNSIHAYGASAKSTTLLNVFGLDHRKIPLVVDSSVTKQGKYIPGTLNHIISETQALENIPDYYLLTIWNYQDEIIRKVRQSGNHHSRFIIPHPQIRVL